jgi:flagellar motor switch protein FliN/FliY
MLMDVSVPIAIELGRTSMAIEDILNLGPGSVVELDKLAGEPVDLLVNNKLLAKGEVVVIDENFGVRITNMVSKPERIRSLQ